MFIITVEGYGTHKYRNERGWMYSLSTEKRSVTKYSPVKLTKRQKRELKRGFIKFIKSGLKPHESPFFNCQGCKKCKGA